MMADEVAEIENKKKTTKKKAGVAKKRVAMKKAGRPRKTAKRGWPKGKKRGKRAAGTRGRAARGRAPARGRSAAASRNWIELRTDTQADIGYWSEFLTFLNANTGKTLTIQTDGKSFSLHAS